MRYALGNNRISDKLSHLVCHHTSEWSYEATKWPYLKSKLETMYDKGIAEEEDAARKQDLKDKKKAVLDAAEKRIKNLSWWKEVKDNALFGNNPFSPGAAKKEKKEVANPVEIPFAPEEELKGPTLFPVSNPKVYHFHPLAFVRQMRRMARSNEIHIFHTGHISKTDLTKAETVIYIYHDKDGGIHELGEFSIIEVDALSVGKKVNAVDEKFKRSEELGNGRTKYTYGNKIVVKGSRKGEIKIIQYNFIGGKIKLVRIPDTVEYVGNTLYNKMPGSTRPYANVEAFACLIGALMVNRYPDVTVNGFTGEDNHGFPSVSHVNGNNADLRYLNTNKDGKTTMVYYETLDIRRQEIQHDAFHQFGWSGFLSHYTHGNKLLKHCKADSFHKDHLHIQSFTPKYINL